jgi:cytochrome c-type protein NapB
VTRSDLPSVTQRVMLIVMAVAAMGGMILTLQRAATQQAADDPRLSYEAMPVRAGDPIASEAGVFLNRPGTQAMDPDTRRRADAHPRTLATYRLLRSYPGAPPRVPHGLTAAEYRTNRCNTCHERGGYSPRFNAYAPVNPHPHWPACLQCHATNDLLVGVPLPQASPDAACRQCHVGTPQRFDETGVDWRPAAWPPIRSGTPVPVIPHDLATRGNCLACHMGPGAIAEIRTTHPERTDCRQCHVAVAADNGVFIRPGSTVAGGPGGMP